MGISSSQINISTYMRFQSIISNVITINEYSLVVDWNEKHIIDWIQCVRGHLSRTQKTHTNGSTQNMHTRLWIIHKSMSTLRNVHVTHQLLRWAVYIPIYMGFVRINVTDKRTTHQPGEQCFCEWWIEWEKTKNQIKQIRPRNKSETIIKQTISDKIVWHSVVSVFLFV